MKSLRFSRNIGLVIFIFLIAVLPSCKTLNLKYNEEFLFCGSNHPDSREFIEISSPTNHRLEISDLQLINLEIQKDESSKLSSKGCLAIPTDGRFLLRSRTREWGKIFDTVDLKGQSKLKLEDFSQSNISINCDASKVLTVSPNFSLQSIILDNVPDDFKEGFKLEYEVVSEKLSSSMKSEVALNLLDDKARPFLLNTTKDVRLSIKVRNILKGQYSDQKTCSFQIDNSPPDARLASNLESSSSTAKIHDREVMLVKLSDSLSFVSEDRDVKEIRYCLKKLDDNFADSDSAKLALWNSSTVGSTCTSENSQTIASNSNISTPSKNGIWSLSFQAVDVLGNISIQKNALFIWYHKEDVELIKTKATSSVALAVQDSRSQDAIKIALDAEESRQALTTQFERNEAYSSTLAGLTNAYHQKGVQYIFPDIFSACYDRMEVTSDAKYILCSKGKTNLLIWDNVNQRVHRDITIIPPSVEMETNNYVLSGDGKLIFSYKSPNESTLWNIETGEIIQPQGIDTFPGRFLALSRSGKFAVYQKDREFYSIVDLTNFSQIAQFPADHTQWDFIDFAPDDSFLLVFNIREKAARIIDVKTGSSKQILHEADLTAGVITPDSSRIITASGDGWMRIWDNNGNKLSEHQNSPTNSSQRISLTANNSTLAASLDHKSIAIFRNSDFQKLREYADVSGTLIQKISAPENSNIIYSSYALAPVTALFLDTGKSTHTLVASEKPIMSMLFNKDGSKLFTSATDSFIKEWDTKNFSLTRKFEFVENFPRRLKLSSDESQIIFTAKHPSIFDLDGNQDLQEFPGHFKSVDDTVMSHDKKRLATCSHDFSAIIWDVQTKKKLHSFSNPAVCEGVLFTLDDKLLITNSNERIFIWDVESGQLLNSLVKHVSPVRGMGLFKDGKRFFSFSTDFTIKVWEINSGKLLQTITTNDAITDAILSEDQSIFVVLQWLGEMSTWDATSGHRLSTFRATDSYIHGIALQPNGNKILSHDGYGRIQFWDQTTAGIVRQICKSTAPYLQHNLCNVSSSDQN